MVSLPRHLKRSVSSISESSLPKHGWKDWIFQQIHNQNLVYTFCWEDPRIDRIALQLSPTDTLLVITSAGCNVLDYVLQSPQHIYAVDVNPRQNALLELKIAAIKTLDFPAFFQMFGKGHLPDFPTLYRQQLRPHLSPWAKHYWDRKGSRFFHSHQSFYFCGTSGLFAKLINFYIDHIIHFREPFNQLIAATTLEQQQQIYEHYNFHDRFWQPALRFWLNSDLAQWMLGVPQSQSQALTTLKSTDLFSFIQHCCEAVSTEIPIQDNYFWQLCFRGEYLSDCCPEYLKPDNFEALKAGLVDKISVHTATVTDFLQQKPQLPITRFVLLDHMDWLAAHYKGALAQEWQAIVQQASPTARILFRSASPCFTALNEIDIQHNTNRYPLSSLLTYNRSLAAELHQRDRVHTYSSFTIADLTRPW
ncbi:MAG: BtaA family protein [Cyanobacteria bacterium J06631_12]